MSWVYILISVLVVSLTSFVGAFTLGLKEKFLNKILLYFVAFSAGALIGDAFLHLLPESTSNGFAPSVSVSLLLGIAIFFILEKFLRWRHCHEIDCDSHPDHLGTMNIVGGGVHNFIDGAIIAASYLVSIPLGITTTLAVLLHEIPSELGHFGVLLHSGYTKQKALLFNFLSACISILGAVFVVLLKVNADGMIKMLIPFTAGGFLYIALTDLVPELHKELSARKSFIQFIFVTLGVMVMVGLLRLK